MHTIVVRLNVFHVCVCVLSNPRNRSDRRRQWPLGRDVGLSRLLAYLLGKIRRGERCAACDCDDDPPSFSFSFPLPIFVALSDRPRLRCSPVYSTRMGERKERKAHPVSPLHSSDASYRLHSCASRSSLAFGRPSSPSPSAPVSCCFYPVTAPSLPFPSSNGGGGGKRWRRGMAKWPHSLLPLPSLPPSN